MLYFIVTPLMGIVYYFYALAVLYEHRDDGGRVMAFSSPPALAYLLLALFNPVSKSLLDIAPGVGYIRGR